MYAVIETGGKQYRVAPGDVIDVERLPAGDGQEGKDGGSDSESNDVVFDRVLMVGGDGADELKVGTPIVEGARVTATRVGDVRGPKLVVFKKKRRKGYRRTNGHRQDYLRVRIGDIQV